MGLFTKKRDVLRCYYEFTTLKDIGPTGDFIKPGLYYTNVPFPAMEVQSNRAWYKLSDGTMESGKPVQSVTSKAVRIWIELKAQPLNWARYND